MSIFHRSSPSLLLPLGLCAALALPACGGKEPPPKTASSDSGANPGEQAKIDKARKKIEEAQRLYSQQRYSEARKLLEEVRALEIESLRFDVQEQLEKVDKRFAKLWANEANDDLEAKKCDAVIGKLAKQMGELKSDVFTRELRKLVAEPVAKCVSAVVDEHVAKGDLAAARKLAESPETAEVIGPGGKKLFAELDEKIVAALKDRLAPDLKAKKWEQAAAKLDDAVKKGDVSEAQGRLVRQALRDALAPELAAQCQTAVGHRDATGMLAKIDKLIGIGGWDVPSDAEATAQDRVLPPELVGKRRTVTVWAEVQRLKAKPVKRADKRWAHGRLTVGPAESAEAASKRDVPAATAVWIVATSKDKVLVADAEPQGAGLVPLLEKALGWVDAKRLATKDTTDWLPPDDQLKSTRVWGPLREGEALLELGVVVDLVGNDASVQRLSDDQIVKTPKSGLRLGRLVKGSKVISFCGEKAGPATIQEVKQDGRSVILACDEGGTTKDETLPALKTKADLLPPGK